MLTLFTCFHQGWPLAGRLGNGLGLGLKHGGSLYFILKYKVTNTIELKKPIFLPKPM